MPSKCGMVAHRYPDRLLDQCTFDEPAKVSGKKLPEYPSEQQSGEDIQLEVNLKRVMADLAKLSGQTLRFNPAIDDTPAK